MSEKELVVAVSVQLDEIARLLSEYDPFSEIADTLYEAIEEACEKADDWLGEASDE